ncbi:MAG TPA: heavy metal translocating P-type ATPase [Patescibacteria group bacterium]|nr:heavy metal translocating P-type ATPase [Patescibacteria group bacterium]
MEHNHNHGAGMIYSCPMHPEIRQNTPGRCPLCGMNLLPVPSGKAAGMNHAGHGQMGGFNKHEGHSTNMFKKKFWVSLVLSVFVVLYSEILYTLLGWTAPGFPGSAYLPLLLGTVVFFYGGWVFLVGGWRELKAGQPGMMTLIGMAITVAFAYSLYSNLFLHGETLWWELTTLITIMLLGHWVEMRAVQGAQGALGELAKLLPDTAEVVRGGKTETIPLKQLQVGDIFVVRPGGKIAADGVIAEGKSEIDESMVTGESKPAEKSVTDQVIAGTINGDGSLQVRVAKIGEQTFLAGVMKLVAEAQNSKSRLQVLSDRAAYYLTIVALIAGALTFVVWLLQGAGVNFALQRTVAVLVITCPHALGLAIPLVASISTNMAAKNGLLVKQRLALEAARDVNAVLFDKTGTLTKGEYGVDTVISASGAAAEEILKLAASVNSRSEHPIAKALAGEAGKRSIVPYEVKDFQRIPGKGARAIINNKEVLVGSATLMRETGKNLDGKLAGQAGQLEKQGKTVTFVIREKQLLGIIALGDVIRSESREAVKKLKSLGVRVAMVTGDSDDVAAWVAGELGIDEYFARVLPEQKAGKVKLLQDKGMKVAMVGDGVNDAPALTQADLGIAIGAGTNVAIESAGIILVKNDPRDIPKIIQLSKLTYRKMLQNLFWATGYNVVALPLAAGVLAAWGILLQPAISAVLMSLSTVIVAINAVLLKRNKLS